MMATKQGFVNIRGKDYKTVALRVSEFREKYPDHLLITEIVKLDDTQCLMLAKVVTPGARIIATGHAHEWRDSSQINGTSYVENCETSAIGRALASFGLGGTEFASANEVVNAIHQQNAPKSHANPPKTDSNVTPIPTPKESVKSVPKDVFDGLPEHEQIELVGIAADVTALSGNPKEALEFLEAQDLDADHKTALWSLLDSRVRAAIKKEKEAA